MNSEKIAEFNRKCAEYMEYEFIQSSNGDLLLTDFNRPVQFDPYHDANHRNKVLEKMRAWCSPWGSGWKCSGDTKTGFDSGIGKTMEAAQISCIASVLGVNQ